MTPKQINTLKELGFKERRLFYYVKKWYSDILGWVEIHVVPNIFTIYINNRRTDFNFTLTKLREIVTKLEKL